MDAAKCSSLFNGKTKRLQLIQLKPLSIHYLGNKMLIRLRYQTLHCSFLCRCSLVGDYK